LPQLQDAIIDIKLTKTHINNVMAGESLFKELELEAFRAGITPRTKESIRWFQDKARQMFRGRVMKNRKEVFEDDLLNKSGKPRTNVKGPVGNMYMFFYDPWEIATFLPMADWNKAGASKVYRDSRKKMV